MKVNSYYEVCKVALCAYEEDGIADFSIKEMSRCGISDRKIGSILGEMVNNGLIENKTKSGYYSRYKIKYTDKCPDYIYNDKLTVGNKYFLLELSRQLTGSELSLTPKYITKLLYPSGSSNMTYKHRADIMKVYDGKDILTILKEVKYIKLKIDENSSNGHLVIDENGVRFSTKKNEADYLCKHCGDKNPINFSTNRYSVCKSCHKEKVKVLQQTNVFNFLHQKSFRGFNSRPNILEYTITSEDIKKQWIAQGETDYYTGLPLKDITKLSVDRIDSSKGYTPDNIVLTINEINIMKNNLTIKEFKTIVTNIYKHFCKE